MPAVFIAAGNLIPFTKGMFVFRAPQPYCAGHSSYPYEGYACFSHPTFVLRRALFSSLRRVYLFFAPYIRIAKGTLLLLTKGILVFRAPQPYCAEHSSPPYEGYTCFSHPTAVLLRALFLSLRRVYLFFAPHSRIAQGTLFLPTKGILVFRAPHSYHGRPACFLR